MIRAIVSLLILLTATSVAQASDATAVSSDLESVSSGISGGDFKVCLTTRPADCVRIQAERLDQASVGNLFVGHKAKVTLNHKGQEQIWNNARVIIDVAQNQVVIEKHQPSKLNETVISLKDLSIRRNEIKL